MSEKPIYVPISLWEWNCQHDRCQCCGIKRNRTCLEPDWEQVGLETHHIVHRSQGGTDEACNLLCLGWRCHHQGAHNGHSKWSLTFQNLLWVKQHCGDGTWDLERLLKMWRGKHNTRTFTKGPPDKFTPAKLP
ncbi:hypothetical protein LCGC14_3137130, partial [marine sediment metagenome]